MALFPSWFYLRLQLRLYLSSSNLSNNNFSCRILVSFFIISMDVNKMFKRFGRQKTSTQFLKHWFLFRNGGLSLFYQCLCPNIFRIFLRDLSWAANILPDLKLRKKKRQSNGKFPACWLVAVAWMELWRIYAWTEWNCFISTLTYYNTYLNFFS